MKKANTSKRKRNQLSGDFAWGNITIPTGTSFTISEVDMDKLAQELQKMFNAPLTVLPKRIEVPTLIVSTFGAWSFDSIGVDLSLLEEKGIAHYFCTSTKTMEEHMKEFRALHPDCEEWEEEGEGASVVVKNATLLEWPGGYWEWELC